MSVPRIVARAAGVAVAFVLALAAAPAAHAAPLSYVALGDSYSSGLGTRSYISDGTSCRRSVYSYPALIAAGAGYALTLRACAGATIADVRSSQLGALSGGTNLVTITAGGNDIGWASVLTECALPAWLSNCNAAIDTAVAAIRTQLPVALGALYADIRGRAPSARVVVVGYPRLFNGVDCSWLTFFSGAEMTRLNATADLLDDVTAAAARAAGFSFADPRVAFTGHAVCDRSAWINNLTYPVDESYHPNRSGQSGYASVVAPVLSGSAPLGVSAAALSAQSASLAIQGTATARLDAGIVPQVVTAPDLTTPKARAAAKAEGVDLSSRASIVNGDRIAESRQIAARTAQGRPVVSTG